MKTEKKAFHGKFWQLNEGIRADMRARGFFAEPGHYLKDHAWVEHEGRWHVFYIRGREVGGFIGTRDTEVGHASTADFSTWRVHTPAPLNGAPTIIRKGGLFYLYANEVVGQVRTAPAIVMATSPDLETWTVHPGNPVYVANPRYYEGAHIRDYHVMPFEGGYLMLFAETNREGLGCVGAIRSRDLVAWEDLGPILALDKRGWGITEWELVGHGIPESPFLLEKDGRWHLLVTDNLVTRTYRFWSEQPLAGWSWDRCAFFHGAPTGWDWAAVPDAEIEPASAAGITAAFELFETAEFGWLASYYFVDPVERKSVLRVEPVQWHDGHPFLQPRWR